MQRFVLILGLFSTLSWTAQAESLSSDPSCERVIHFLPQRHSSRDSSLTEAEKSRLDILARSQYNIAKFIMKAGRSTPVFMENTYAELVTPDSGDRRFTDLRRTRAVLRKALADDKTFQDLTPEQKELLVLTMGSMAVLHLGNIDKIWGTIPSESDEYKSRMERADFWKTHSELRTDDTYGVDILFRKREKWALNEILRFFKKNPNAKSAILIFGGMHNFPEYSKFLPGTCIHVPDGFQEDFQPPRYMVNDEGLEKPSP